MSSEANSSWQSEVRKGFIQKCSPTFRKNSAKIEKKQLCNGFEMVCTDLGSLIGIFDCGYSTVCKFSNFPVILILREISFS